MISDHTPNERPNHASDRTLSRAWKRFKLRRVYLEIPHVVPIKLVYLPRLKDVRRETDAIIRVRIERTLGEKQCPRW